MSTFLIAINGLALVGWAADLRWLVQPVPGIAPMRVGSALGWLVIGLGLLASAKVVDRARQAASFAFAGLAVYLGTLPFQHAAGISGTWEALASIRAPSGLDWHGTPPGQLVLSSGVFVTLGAIGLLAILSRRRGVWSSIVLAACGGIIMLLAAAVIAGQLLGMLDAVKNGAILGSALQSTLGALVLATYFNVLAWTKQAGFSPPPAWLPISVGTGSLVTVLLLWRALLASEATNLIEQGRVAALSTRSSVRRQLQVNQRALRRMATNSAAPDSMWTTVVTQMVEDVAGLEAVLWTDSTGSERGSDRHASRGVRDSVRLSLLPYVAMLRELGDATRYLPMIGDPARTLMIVPRCLPSQRCTERFVGVIDSRSVLGSVLSDTVLGFEMAIGSGGRWFRASAPPPAEDRFLVTEALLSRGPPWQLGVWPSPRTSAVTPSSLSDIVLLLGVCVSVLLALAVRLLQSVSETARLDERAKLDGALQSTTDGLWDWDLQTGLVTRSQQLWSRLGYVDGASLMKMEDWLAIVHPQDRASVESSLQDHLHGRVDAYDAQYRVRSASGRWHDFLDRGRIVLRAPDGQPLKLLGMFADITDRRHAEEALRQAETMSTMGRLAGRIAHEINNPLAGIQSAFLLIKDAIPAAHPHFKYVGAIEREVQRISQVTRQLYETYRPETESSSHAPVQTVVGDAVAFLEQVNRNTGVTIELSLGDVAAVVRLPNAILRQCVYNLVQNAIEASPPGSRVRVFGSIEGDEFMLSVRDTGPGVPPALRDDIFEPFVSTKPSQLSTGGMGMGLALVRRALDAAGGSIELIDAPGGGAEFIARIPLAEQPHGVTA